MSVRPVSRGLAALAACLLTVYSAGSAFADVITPDGDGVSTATPDIVLTSCRLPQAQAGLVEVKRTGGETSTPHYAAGETLTIAITDNNPNVSTVVTGGPVTVPAGYTANGATTAFTFPISTTISAGAASGSAKVDVKVTSPANPTGKTASFNVTWNCVNNLPPVVTVGGVTQGGNYEFGSVPAASCAWTDDHDGQGTVVPTLSPLTGPRAADGLGSRTATCSYTDAGGLTRTASATYAIVDTTPPSLTSVADIAADAVEASGAPVTYTAPTATDAVDGTRPASCVPASGATFPLGTTTVTCSATDLSAHTGTTSFTVSVADHSSPTVTVPDSTTIDAPSPAGAAYTFTASADDNVDGALTPTCTTGSGSTFPFGVTEVTCSATDAAGNKGSASFTVTVQDRTDPNVTVHEPESVEATGPAGAAVTWTAPTASDDVDGPRTVSCDKTSGAVFPVGSTTVTCTATDTHGNTGTATFEVEVTDTTAPAITVPADLTREASSPQGAVVTYTASAHDLVDGDGEVTCTPASGSQFALDQTTTVSCTATDSRGNNGSKQFTVHVVDKTAPALPNLANVVDEATGPSGAVVTYSVDTASDAVDGDVAVTCAPTSGSTFVLGATTVNCTAMDSHGNTSAGHFSVTVRDTTPPAFDPISVPTAEATGPGGAAVSFNPRATDLVDAAPAVSCDPASGSVFPLGATQVTCTATDAAGNHSEQAFTVNVADTTEPVVSTVPSQTIEATSAAGAAFSWVMPTATDMVDGSRPVSCDHAQDSTFPLGATVVTCSATDLAGNTGEAAFTVTVEDSTAPSFGSAPNLMVPATSAAGAVVGYATPMATDLVDGATPVACTPASGTRFPLGSTTVTCTSTDAAGNAATRTFTVHVVVGWSGVLAPVTNGGTYKLGSTIPVKFLLTGASADVSNLQATLWVRKLPTAVVGGEAAALSTSAATTGNLFRCTDGQYLFNLNTKPLSVGSYELRIDLADGVSHTVTITLR